jgi:hypothetical protein
MSVLNCGCARAWKGRERRANRVCSLFVLISVSAMTAVLTVSLDLQTVICQVPSVSRAIVAAAKLQEPAEASKTLRWPPLAVMALLAVPTDRR